MRALLYLSAWTSASSTGLEGAATSGEIARRSPHDGRDVLGYRTRSSAATKNARTWASVDVPRNTLANETSTPHGWWSLVRAQIGSSLGTDNSLGAVLSALRSSGMLFRTTELNLSGWGLTGSIPEWLGEATWLTRINLEGNHLEGTIPPSMGNLTRLVGLFLANNSLSGPIPSEVGQLYELEELCISQNLLSGSIPRSLGNLTKLRQLIISHNQLQDEIPAEIGFLTALEELNFAENFLVGELPDLSRLTRLQIFNVAANSLHGELPRWVGGLTQLTYLAVARNTFQGGIPRAIGNLQQVQLLELRGNFFTGPLPVEVGLMAGLKWLDVSDNNVTGTIPSAICQLQQLIGLYLSANAFQGTVPGCLGSLSNLRELLLDRNIQLSGPLPSELQQLKGVEKLDLSWISIGAPLPSWIGELTSLKELWLDEGSVWGEIPAAIGNLSSLQLLSMSGNRLGGCLPRTLANLRSLRFLRLGANGLACHLPPELAQLPVLEEISLQGNQLCGSIPAEWGNFTSLVELQLWHNRLEGAIPPQLGQLRKLQRLGLSGNKLQGRIPPELGNLRQLNELDIGSNQLEGQIPGELGQLHALRELYLDNNALEGSIPVTLFQLHLLRKLNLGLNNLRGEIPAELTQLRLLQSLRLDRNFLTGPLPDFSPLQVLKNLILSKNQLTGPIPPSLGSIPGLEILSLDENQFSGTLPTELGALRSLRELWVGNNQLTGPVPTELFEPSNKLLKTVCLRNNQLSGPLPTSLGQLQTISLISVGGNAGLNGTFPDTTAAVLLNTLSAPGCGFTDAQQQSWALTFLDFSGNQLSALPGGWENLGALQTLKLSRNNISQWPLRGVPKDRCGWGLYEDPFRWPQLAHLELSENPLNQDVQILLDSLSYLSNLQVLQASNAGLFGDILDFQVGKEQTCKAFLPCAGFSNLDSMDLSNNRIWHILPEPPLHLTDARLSNCGLLELHPSWWNLGQQSQIRSLDLRGNPKLGPPRFHEVINGSGKGCAAAGSGLSKELVPNTRTFEPVPGTRYECAALCSWKDLSIEVDGWNLSPSTMCRCIEGSAGNGTSCTLCPVSTFSRRLNGMASVCEGCGAFRHTEEAGSTKQSQCLCNSRQIVGLRDVEGACQCSEGEYIDVDQGMCQVCPAFRRSRYGTLALGLEACHSTMTSHSLSLGLVLMFLVAWILLPHSFGLIPYVIKDVSFEENRVVVTTNNRHFLLAWLRVPVSVKIHNTGNIYLDSRVFLAVPDATRRLQIRPKDGSSIPKSLASSMGELRVLFPQSMLHCGVFYVPSIVLSASLVAGATFIIRSQRIPMEPAAAMSMLGAVIAMCLHVGLWTSASMTPMESRRRRFYKVLTDGCKPQACEPGGDRAISAKQLVDFMEYFQAFIGARDMYYVVSNIITPLTEKDKLSYAELAGPGQVTWFVSHTWGHLFQDFIATVMKHAKVAKDPFARDWLHQTYWICSFSNNQWDIKNELGGDWSGSSFYKALCQMSCKGTLMVLDQQALPLKRAWCLFEVLQTMLRAGERSDFEGLLLGTASGVLNYGLGSVDVAMALAERLTKLDLRDAEASEESDLSMIHALVEDMDGGFDHVNTFVRRSIRDALQVMQTAFDGNIDSVVTTLSRSMSNDFRQTRLNSSATDRTCVLSPLGKQKPKVSLRSSRTLMTLPERPMPCSDPGSDIENQKPSTMKTYCWTRQQRRDVLALVLVSLCIAVGIPAVLLTDSWV